MKKVIIILGLLVLGAMLGAAVSVAAQDAPTPTPAPATPPPPPAWLGLEVADINPGLAEKLGINLGVVVVKVVEGGPAAQAGILVKDVILSAGGKAVNRVSDLMAVVKAAKVGDVLELAGRRGDTATTWKVTLAARPAPEPKSLFPNVPELAGVTREQLFSHVLSGQVNMLDKDGKPLKISWVAGVVTAVTETSVTLKPNDGTADLVYNTADVKVLGKLEKDAKVVVVSVNDQVRLIVRAKPLALPQIKRPVAPMPPKQPVPALPALKGVVNEMVSNGFVLAIGDQQRITVVLAKDIKVRPENAEVKAGVNVLVTGKKQDDGTFLASHVLIVPQVVPPKVIERGKDILKDRLDKARQEIALRVLKGEIKELAGSVLVLRIEGNDVKVVLAKDVKIVPGKDALKVGAKVAVSGKKQEDGTFVVSIIQVHVVNAAPKAPQPVMGGTGDRQQGTVARPANSQPVKSRPLALP